MQECAGSASFGASGGVDSLAPPATGTSRKPLSYNAAAMPRGRARRIAEDTPPPMPTPEPMPTREPAPTPDPDTDDAPARTLPAFTPVPRQKQRSNGWNAEVQHAFIEALAETGSVEAACRRVNRASVGAYALRRHPEGESFRAAWQAALDLGIQRVEDVAMDRALNGVDVPVYAYGRIVGTRRVYNDRLLMFMLRNRAPQRFAADGARGMSALDRQAIARLKKEWKREQAIEHDRNYDSSGRAFLEKIKQMHRNWYLSLTPEARAAYRELRRLEADSQGGMWRGNRGAEPLSVAEAEYEEFFGEGRDGRAQIWKVVEMGILMGK